MNKPVSHSPKIELIDLQTQQQRIRQQLEQAIARVLDHGQYILGPEVTELENKLAEFTGARHVITCASGTDALLLALLALEIGPGDAVFVPSFTFVSTVEVVALLRATPYFVDVDPDTYLIDLESLSRAVEAGRKARLNPRVIIPVDLFGQPADYRTINQYARAEGMIVLADAAQSFGASQWGGRVGTLATVTATSFFPAKPLGCYGDGGALFTSDPGLAEILRSLRVHGKGRNKYDNVRVGINGRLDTLQAAILIQKLSIFEEEMTLRNLVAQRYTESLGDVVKTPVLADGSSSVWAQYTVRVSARDKVARGLEERGIPSAVYYPLPLHRQAAYKSLPAAPGGLSVSDLLAAEVLSLPMHPYLDQTTQQVIIDALRQAVTG